MSYERFHTIVLNHYFLDTLPSLNYTIYWIILFIELYYLLNLFIEL